MMKKLLLPGLIIITLILGLFCPVGVFAIKDYQLLHSSSSFQIEPIHFQSDTNLTDVMNIMNGDYYSVEISYSSTRHSASDIFQAAVKILASLQDENLIGDSCDFSGEAQFHHNETPLMLVEEQSNTASTSSSDLGTSDGMPHYDMINHPPDRNTAIVWDCHIYDSSNGEYHLTLDDKTSRLLSITCGGEETLLVKDVESYYETASRFQSFLEKYYEDYMIQPLPNDYNIATVDMDQYLFFYQLTDTSETKTNGILQIYPDAFTFTFGY